MKKLSVLLVVVLVALAAQSFAGVVLVAKTTAEGGMGVEQQNSVAKSWVSGDHGKTMFEESSSPLMGKGTYIITKDGGKTMYLVSPEDKTYMKWDLDSIMGFAGGAMKMMNMKFSDPKVEALGEEPDGLIAGIPTVHYRFRTSYTMSMSFMMMKKTTRVVKEEDIWAAPKLIDAALGIWLRKTPPKTGNEDLDGLIKAEMGKVQGFPLKRKTVTTNTDEKGKVETNTVTMEVTELQMVPVPDSTFEIPQGYKETSLMGTGEGEGSDESNPLLKMMGGKKEKP
ncbi:MAG TPA: DUF4412 domain-containing protein [Thermoanaerobaculaceae bacterium]|nr:DUF4412 domain-containing protein [Thermoanaerobaculaceae bacterium]